jgi:hypothetical protein
MRTGDRVAGVLVAIDILRRCIPMLLVKVGARGSLLLEPPDAHGDQPITSFPGQRTPHIHTHTGTHIHTRTHAHTQVYTGDVSALCTTLTHERTHTHRQAHTHTHTGTRAGTHTLTHIRMRVCTQTCHSLTHSHMHTRSRTNAHVRIRSLARVHPLSHSHRGQRGIGDGRGRHARCRIPPRPDRGACACIIHARVCIHVYYVCVCLSLSHSHGVYVDPWVGACVCVLTISMWALGGRDSQGGRIGGTRAGRPHRTECVCRGTRAQPQRATTGPGRRTPRAAMMLSRPSLYTHTHTYLHRARRIHSGPAHAPSVSIVSMCVGGMGAATAEYRAVRWYIRQTALSLSLSVCLSVTLGLTLTLAPLLHGHQHHLAEAVP